MKCVIAGTIEGDEPHLRIMLGDGEHSTMITTSLESAIDLAESILEGVMAIQLKWDKLKKESPDGEKVAAAPEDDGD